MVDNPRQIVTDFEEEVVKKKNKCVAKRKEQLAKLCTPIVSSLSSCLWSPAVLLSRYIPAPVSHHRSPAVLLSHHVLALVFCLGFTVLLLSCHVLAPVSCPGLPAVLLFYCLPTLIAHPESLAVLLFCRMPAPAVSLALSSPCCAPVSCCEISALLLLLFVFAPPLLLRSSPLRIFKQL